MKWKIRTLLNGARHVLADRHGLMDKAAAARQWSVKVRDYATASRLATLESKAADLVNEMDAIIADFENR